LRARYARSNRRDGGPRPRRRTDARLGAAVARGTFAGQDPGARHAIRAAPGADLEPGLRPHPAGACLSRRGERRAARQERDETETQGTWKDISSGLTML